jgi:ribose transport system ATP-binding protein
MSEKLKIIDVKNCTKIFPGVRAFDNVNFDLYEGEIHCIVGENGAGKSTFIKILSGAYKPDGGEIYIEGILYHSLTPKLARELRIFTIYQGQFLLPSLSIKENIFLGEEPKNRFGHLDYRRMSRETKELFTRLQLDIDADRMLGELSMAERHLVQIAKALIRQPRILILDEPTASLGRRETDILLEFVKRIADEGVGIIYISHHLEEIFRIADRVSVLRDGAKINTYSSSELEPDRLIVDMVGHSKELFHRCDRVSVFEGLLEAIDYAQEGVVEKSCFTVRKGEIVGFSGMVGAGRTELMQLIFGARARNSGILRLNSIDITPNSPREAIRNGICYITKDRQQTGLILKQSVLWNSALVSHTLQEGIRIPFRKERCEIQKLCNRLNVKAVSLDMLVRNLSGGNQQKIVLVKWLMIHSDIFIFDEPTRGIDIGVKEDIHKIMTQLATSGKYIIIVSSDLPELLSVSDRIYIMKKGSIRMELNNTNLTEDQILAHSL